MSHAIAFDTLSSVKRMKEAGFTDAQAETQTRIIAELVDDRLATKQDLENLATKNDISRLEFELKLIKWMLALVIASTVLPALKHLFGG
ncbi:MAG: CCDC90 family protein [Magnetococcus sp. YQC-5]